MLTTVSKTSGLRKAAVLVASLDPISAERVLAQMGTAPAQQVRRAVATLGPVGEDERQRVLEEFFRLKPLMPDPCPAGIELDGQLAAQLAAPRDASEDVPQRYETGQTETVPFSTPAGQDDRTPFGFLREAEAEKLARALAVERPQIIALVLAHLPSQQAGDVLVRLTPALQAEVVRRLVDLEEADPDILHEVERGLLARLSEQVRMQKRRAAGLSAVQGIVEAAEPAVGTEILHNLAAHDRRLADRLGRVAFAFDDLVEVDCATLATLVETADRELLLLGLVGALPALVDRVLRQFPDAEAKRIRRRLDHFGPVRLSDVEEARRRIAELTEELAIRHGIELPRRTERRRRAA